MGDEMKHAVRQLILTWKDAGKVVSAEEIRKWMQPHKDIISAIIDDDEAKEILKKLIVEAFPDGEWQGPVALNQILHLARTKDVEELKKILEKFYEVWNAQPINLSAILVEWRRQTIGSRIDSLTILETLVFDQSKPSYFSEEVSENSIAFFMNVMKDDFGVDMDALHDSLLRVVGDRAGDVFRLVDVDAPISPEEFANRVEKAVEAITTASGRGVDPKKIVEVWDELADEGGERFEKLAAAVKRVAEEAVKERFREKVLEKMKDAKIPIVNKPFDVSELLTVLHSKGIARIEQEDVEISEDFDELIRFAHRTLLKTSPSAMYLPEEIAAVVTRLMKECSKGDDPVKIAKVLDELGVDETKRLLSEDKTFSHVVSAVKSVMSRTGVDPEELGEALEQAMRKPFRNAEDLAQEIYNKLHEMKE